MGGGGGGGGGALTNEEDGGAPQLVPHTRCLHLPPGELNNESQVNPTGHGLVRRMQQTTLTSEPCPLPLPLCPDV